MPLLGVVPHMRERKPGFRRTLIAVLLGVAVVSAGHEALRAAGAADEVRALWVRRTSLDSEESIRRMVASASSSGFNTLFVQIADQSGPAAPTFDPITDTITQAHAAGLRVHAWIDVTRVAPAGELPFARDHVIYQHQE